MPIPKLKNKPKNHERKILTFKFLKNFKIDKNLKLYARKNINDI